MIYLKIHMTSFVDDKVPNTKDNCLCLLIHISLIALFCCDLIRTWYQSAIDNIVK